MLACKTSVDQLEAEGDCINLIPLSLGRRAKEGLVVDFINQSDLDAFDEKANIIDAFFTFARAEQLNELDHLLLSAQFGL